jgi:hypothetical protein
MSTYEKKLHEAFVDLQRSITTIDQLEYQAALPPVIKGTLKGYVREMEGLARRMEGTETVLRLHEYGRGRHTEHARSR